MIRLCETCQRTVLPDGNRSGRCKSCAQYLPDSHLTPRERNIRDKVSSDYYREFSTCSGGGSR